MKKIFFLGSKNIGAKCFEYLVDNSKNLEIEIIGILTNSRGHKLLEIAKNNSIEVYESLDSFLTIKELDLAISVQYHEILSKQHLSVAKNGIFNLHMAPMPEYRGCNQFSFAIINREESFGTSIHLMDDGIDTGQLYFEKRFDIPSDIWVKELFDITEKHSFDLFKDSIRKLINLQLTPIQKSMSCPKYFHLRKDISKINIVDLDWPKEKIERHIRATAMPGFLGPFLDIKGTKMSINFLNTDEH